MNNNDILRAIRYAFDFNDDKMMSFLPLAVMTHPDPKSAIG